MLSKKKLLEQLAGAEGYVSGEEISHALGVSRTAVWKSIQSLRGLGFEIESVTNRGYRLMSSPDVLTPETIRAGLKTVRLAQNAFCLEETDSTNDEAKRRAQEHAPDGALFLAENQTGGKGRLGRAWKSEPGTGLWFSVLLRTGFTPETVSCVTLIAGLAVCKAIRAVTGCNAAIKWPNDVICGSKKLCGILTEMAAEMERIEYVVVGIGVNVNIPAFPEELREKATSLMLETGGSIKRLPVLQAILSELEALLFRFRKEGISPILEEYRPLCASLGRVVTFTRDGRQVEGVAEDVSGMGELVVRCGDTEYAVNSGEVSVQGIYTCGEQAVSPTQR